MARPEFTGLRAAVSTTTLRRTCSNPFVLADPGEVTFEDCGHTVGDASESYDCVAKR